MSFFEFVTFELVSLKPVGAPVFFVFTYPISLGYKNRTRPYRFPFLQYTLSPYY
jgi:hypothetical protein